MDINIILDPSDIKTAISEYLKTKYGIIQSDKLEMIYSTGAEINQKIICSGIIEITKPYEIEF